MPVRTRFTHPSSVDAWDAHFRWRRGDELRERTIDETWSRVAAFAACRESRDAGDWMQRYSSAFARWQWLPDERLLAHAGTDVDFGLHDPAAVLNAAAFVIDPGTGDARFDHDAFAACAAVAVRFLDDALLAMPASSGKHVDLSVGMLGMADALRLLAIPYDSPDATREAAAMASALARGALRASVALADERGADPGIQPSRLEPLWLARNMPCELIDDAHRHGLRHRRLTAIRAHPLLARLANEASDALDPPRTGPANAPHARTRTRIEGQVPDRRTLPVIQRAVQPWIDAPICACVAPEQGECVSCC